MRILVISQSAWNTTNSFGNTVTNWFDGWKDCRFYHFYTRQQEPNTQIVKRYFRASELEIIKKGLFKKDIGKSFYPDEIINNVRDREKSIEQNSIIRLHKNKNELIYWAIERTWLSKRWISNSFLHFIKEADPDILFAFAYAPYILAPAIECLKREKKNLKTVLYVADDVLEGYNRTAWFRRHYLVKQLNYCIKQADKLYAASEEMAEKYRKIYGIPFSLLYKGCVCDYKVRNKLNKPLRIIYAGNLLYGRITTLSIIAKILSNINKDGVRAVLEIYSNTTLIDGDLKILNDSINSFYMGVRTYDEIKIIMNHADIVLHVESFEKSQTYLVKYSFSTKVIDCLQSGSCVIAIGPKGIASIDFFNHVDGAVVVNELIKIESVLNMMISELDMVDRAYRIRKYALAHHEIEKVREGLRGDFEVLLQQ